MNTRTTRPGPRLSRTRRRGLAVLAGTALLAVPVVALAAAPTAQTAPVDSSLLTDTYALISGTINPGGTASSYHFDYGTTTDYGSSTPVTSAGNGTADVPRDRVVHGPKPPTTLHLPVGAQPGTPQGP